MARNFDLFCLTPFVFVLFSSSIAHYIPQYGVVPRQAISNSSFAPSTSISTPTPTRSSGTATITSSPSSRGNGTCPTTYAPNFPVEFATFTTSCQAFSASLSNANYYEYADECLASYCSAAFVNAIESYESASKTKWTTSTRVFFSGSEGTGKLSTVVVSQSTWTETFTFVVPPAKAVSPTAPCCGHCTISAATVQLYFWPETTETASPVVTGLPPNATAAISNLPVNGSGSYVDDSGFTFISPSIYIGFTSLGAHDRCGLVGTPVYNTTMAFDPTEISTILPLEATATCTGLDDLGGVSAVLTGTEWTVPPPQPLTYADVAQNCSTIEGYYYFTNNPSLGAAGDPCHPVLAIPTKVRQLQAEWNDCGANYDGGFYDPPKTLHQGPLLVPTTADPGQSATPSAAPSTTAQPPSLPDQTSDPNPPASSGNPPPASSNLQPQQSTAGPETSKTPTSIAAPNNSENSDPSASLPVQTNQPQPPINSDSQPGSSTTIVVGPPSSNPTTNPQASNNPINPNPPVLTLGSTNDPSNTNPNGQLSVVTLIPTVIPPIQNIPNPQNPNNNPQPSGSVVIIGSQTLSPGGVITVGGTTSTLSNGQTTVVGGTRVVLDPQGTQVIIGGTSTVNLPPATPAQQTAAPAVLTIGGQTITAAPSGLITIGGKTLLPGSTIVVDGTTVSLAAGGTQIVVDGSTIPLTAAVQTTGAPLMITYDGVTMTENSLSQFIIGGQTLTVGGTVTASGTTYILTTNAQGSTVFIAGTAGVSRTAGVSIAALSSAISTKSTGNGSGSGSPTAAGSGPATPQKTGAGERISVAWGMMIGLLCLGGWIVVTG